MTHRLSNLVSAAAFLSLAFVFGCNTQDPGSSEGGVTSNMIEGDDPGECSDGADNDADGYFDCQDNGCWGSPDCDGSGNGNGTGTGGNNNGTGTGTGSIDCQHELCDITAVEVNYTIVMETSGLFDGFGGICPCTLEFQGSAAPYEVDEAVPRLTMFGYWNLVTPEAPAGTTTTTTSGLEFSECPDISFRCGTWFTDALWWDKQNLDAYQSFRMDTQLTTILDWVVHESPTTFNPSASPLTDRQYYVTDLASPYNHDDSPIYSTTEFVELPPDLALFGAEITHTWEATFTK